MSTPGGVISAAPAKSWWSGITSTVSDFVGGIVSAFTDTKTAFSPLASVQGTPTASQLGTVISLPLSVVGSTAFATSKAAETVSSGISNSASKILTAASDYIVSKPIKSAAIAAVGVEGARLYSSSTAIQKGVSSVFSEVGKEATSGTFVSNVGKAIDNPSLKNVENIYSESPILATAATAGLAYLGGKALMGAANTVSTLMNTSAVKANTAATLSAGSNSLPDTSQDTGKNVISSGTESTPAKNEPIPSKIPRKSSKRRQSRNNESVDISLRVKASERNNYIRHHSWR